MLRYIRVSGIEGKLGFAESGGPDGESVVHVALWNMSTYCIQENSNNLLSCTQKRVDHGANNALNGGHDENVGPVVVGGFEDVSGDVDTDESGDSSAGIEHTWKNIQF